MDIQLKKGLLEVCVLASLLQEDSYGYQLSGNLRIHSISDFEAAGCRQMPHHLFPGAQRQAAKILQHHPGRDRPDSGIFERLAGNSGGL